MTLDYSSMTHLVCKHRFKKLILEGLIPASSGLTSFGSAFHRALELLDKGHNAEFIADQVLEGFADVNRTELIVALLMFKTAVKLPSAIEINGKPAVEYKFKFAYASDCDLAGTLDRIHIEDDKLIFTDYKASYAKKEDTIEETLESYQRSLQLPFYVWSCLNDPAFPEELKEYIRQARYRMDMIVVFFKKTPPSITKVSRGAMSDAMMSNVERLVNANILTAIELSSTSYAPYDGLLVYKACQYCALRAPCMVMGTPQEDEILSRYDRKVYDPMTHR